ncbi:CwfJ C-terminus 1-domain-containing protein-like protein [Geopyxis carbonaria]|nr:CwfJ C-terminus 1-domain-containing protein-like protein [Geopyxis carbonaria]
MSSKVIVVGAPHGRFAEVFSKLATLHSKNSFVCAIIVGDLFGAPLSSTTEEPHSTSASPADSIQIDRLLRGEIVVPLPTYFTLGSSPLPPAVLEKIESNAGEVCENLFFLGKRGVLNTSEGIRIVALGGQLDEKLVGASASASASAEVKNAPFYSATDAAGLKGANNTDLLITYNWPAGVESGSKVPLPANRDGKTGSQPIAELARALRPRYHFCPGGDAFYEREPYRNDLRGEESLDDRRATRFISMGDYGNAAKAKPLYAFTINVSEPQAIPENATTCPYVDEKSRGRKRPADDNANGGSTFFWGDHASSHGHGGHNHKRRGGNRRHEPRPPPGPENCFFCLSYPQLEKHLIVSIGSESYLTTAKGPLTSAATNPDSLTCSAHILIIPFSHTPTLSSIEEPETKTNTLLEMSRYRAALHSMFAVHSCTPVTFEIRRRNGVHAHQQVIPVKTELLEGVDPAFDATVKADRDFPPDAAFIDEADLPTDADAFVYWTAPGQGRALLLPEGQFFDPQFGRRALAGVVGVRQGAVNWRDCVMSREDETKDAEAFKALFKEFDFSME